jgi:hypothetical protein
MAKIRSLPRELAKVKKSDAQWEITSILVSISTFLFPLSFSFWAMWVSLDGGEIMLPSSVPSVIFASLSALSFVAWIVVTLYAYKVLLRWYRESATKKDDISQELAELRTELTGSIDNLVTEVRSLLNEIRQDRNERNEL